MVSKPDFDMYPAADAKRRAVIKKTYRNAKKNGDENVYFVDGQKLFGKEDRENCYVDGCHPTDLGFYRMAKEIYKVIKKLI
jgi:lysophospholipase L1-like esterase